jgi:hypothetical protein
MHIINEAATGKVAKKLTLKQEKKLNPWSGENPDLAAASMKYQTSEKQFYAFIVKHCARRQGTVSFYMQMVLSKGIQRKSSWSNFSQESGVALSSACNSYWVHQMIAISAVNCCCCAENEVIYLGWVQYNKVPKRTFGLR